MSIIVDHWRKLTGAVHPEDADVFKAYPHSFNLDFPSAAYIGDVVNAPVVLLDANGGYDPVATPAEFDAPDAVTNYIQMIHHPRVVDPGTISPYYASSNYRHWIANGQMVLVNAVAYRSPKISKEPNNKNLVEKLPSVALHRRWLYEELLPQAKAGQRLVVAHRNGLWKLNNSKTVQAPDGVCFTNNPISADVSTKALMRIVEFLRGRAQKPKVR